MEWDARLSTPGSPVCAPDWLALREPADAAARSAELAAVVAARAPAVVRDLGCGSGSMARWLGPRLMVEGRAGATWFLHDRDPELLAIAAGHGTPVPGELADLTELRADLVTTSALLDLLTAEEVGRIAGLVVDAEAAALFTLSVTGGAELYPAEPLDAELAAAFDAHQRRDGLLGPDAGAVAAEALRDRGARVTARPSPWVLGPGTAALLEEWLRGWIGAAVVAEPGLVAEAGPYLRRRLDALAEGELRALVPHVDLLAVS